MRRAYAAAHGGGPPADLLRAQPNRFRAFTEHVLLRLLASGRDRLRDVAVAGGSVVVATPEGEDVNEVVGPHVVAETVGVGRPLGSEDLNVSLPNRLSGLN